MTTRRTFISQVALGSLAFTVSPQILASTPIRRREDLKWFNAMDMEVEGKGWSTTTRYFDRLPSKAEKIVREPVWNLSRHSAGMSIRFITDSPIIQVKYSLFLERLAMPHMPATGVSGIDLYARNNKGLDRWMGVTRPQAKEIDATIAQNIRPGKRMYTMYLPLYNGVDSLEIGVPGEHSFEQVEARKEKPILFYGTSIMHGACASRPGMSFPAILGRRLNRSFINLAFSGNGRMEIELADLLSELDPCVYAIDCLPNMNEEMVSERAIPLVKRIRENRPNTPILLVEDRSFTNSEFFPGRQKRHETNRTALRESYYSLLDQGVSGLYYLDGEQLLGSDGEAATDGSHPSDLGMVRYADAYEPALRSILKHF